MSKDGINSKDFIIGTLIGGIIGATTALFLAPKSGKQLREELNEQASAVLDKSEQFANNTKEKTADYTHAVTEQSSKYISLLKETVGQRDNETNELLEEVEGNTSETAGAELIQEVEATNESANQSEEVQNMLKDTQEALAKAENRIE